MIAETLYSQVDADGRELILTKEIGSKWSDNSADDYKGLETSH
jgi:hypothetical protein